VSQLYLKQSRDPLPISRAWRKALTWRAIPQKWKSSTSRSLSIKNEYDHILQNIEARYRVIVKDFQNTAKAQAR
jgi:hypothetical protein